MTKEKKIYSMLDNNIAKINEISGDLSINKSNVVNMAIDSFEYNPQDKKLKLQAEKILLINKINNIDLGITELNDKIIKNTEILRLLEVERDRYREIIKAKFASDKKLDGINIARRMSVRLKCDYLDLLPL